MNKKDIKYIRQIAERLPVVYDQTVSGYYAGYNDDGEKVNLPNIVNHPINHVRRMRKAYELNGLDGIKNYLDMIYKLQIQRNENIQNLQTPEDKVEVPGDDTAIF
jgi:hypothetical protein